MSNLSYPFSPSPGDDADVTQVMADFAAVQGVVNGNLEMGVNIVQGAPASLSGNDQLAGTSNGAAAADHTHIVRGFEQLSTDPSTSNFEGRMYLRTGDDALRECVDASGSGTWITIGNLTSADLPNHAANHTQTGSDSLPAGAISASMLGRGANLSTTVLGGDVNTLVATTWTDILTGITLTTTAANQIVTFTGAMIAHETNVADCRVAWRIRQSSTTIAGRPGFLVHQNETDVVPISQIINVAVASTYTLKLQAWRSNPGGINIQASESDTSETLSTQLEVLVG